MWKFFDRKRCKSLYQVSDEGEVRSAMTGKILKTRIHQGYKYLDDKPVHRIVAEAFISNPDELLEIDHINRDKLNNNVSNLRWCDRQQNIHNSSITKLSNKQREYIRYSKLQTKYLVEMFDVTRSYIQAIRR